MKKHILFLSIAAMMAAFTACEDVPAPYELNVEGGTEEPDGPKTLPYTESFATTLGAYTNYTTDGGGAWVCDYSTAKASGYDNGTKVTTAGTYYLVSPKISLADLTEGAHVTYDYILRYNKGNENQQVLISSDFVDDPKTATWTLLRQTHTEGTDWVTFEKGVVNFPDSLIGQDVVVAFRYSTNATSGSTWEVKNVSVQSGKVEGADPEGTTTAPEVGGVKTLPYSEAFSSTMGSFANETVSGSGAWIIDYSTAKATGYDNSSKLTTAGTYYLVSPEIDLNGVTEAHVAYEYILRYNKGNENQQLFITASYGENAATTEWTLLKNDHKEGTDWITFEKADIDIPADFLGKTIRLAFYYNTNATSGSTWEVRNFSISEGKAGESTGDDNTGSGDVAPVGDNLVGNGDFEAWNGSVPANWKSITTASSASLSQSSDAHGGSYAVCVEGTTSGNKRLAYKEIMLKAGTYNIKFYAKAATSTGASIVPGYVPVVDGKVGTYMYGDYVNDLTTSEWVEVSQSFTLTTESVVNLVIMNSKKVGGAVLIDDYSLTTSDGALVDGGNSDSGNDDGGDSGTTTPTDAIYSNTFATNPTDWTIDNKHMGEGLSYVWAHSTYNSDAYMKASAYKGGAVEAESWLISPALDLSGVTSATFSFSHTCKFCGNMQQELTVWATADGSNWTQLTISAYPSNSDYTFVAASADLSAFAGKSGVKVAFKYISSASAAGTWEVNNVVIK